jgi:hypothetical protein
MTAHEILLETVRLRGEDPTDTGLLSEYNAVALIGMNEGYRHICATVIHPRAVEAVELDANKRFAASDLTNTPKQIISVTEHEDYSEPADWSPSTRLDWKEVSHGVFVVPDAEAEATVYVNYTIIPPELVNPYPVGGDGHTAGEDATSPSYIPEEYHRSLCYMALSKLCARDGLKSDAMLWDAGFYSSLDTLSNTAPQTEIEPYYRV